MRIREAFATAITDRIEPVVKVLDRKPGVIAGELDSLVVTPQWERFLRQALDAYTDAATRDDEDGIGIWISGFFGSGKSLLMKVLGVLLEGGVVDGLGVRRRFLARVPAASPDRADLERYLDVCERKIATTIVGGNLHAEQATGGDTLALIAFKLFAGAQGYTNSWPLAWAVEYYLDAQGRREDFRRRAEELAGQPWDELVADTAFHTDSLYQAAADTMPAHFRDIAAVERAVNAALAEGGVTSSMLIERLRAWCAARDRDGRRHKLLIQLDELGQWIRSGNSNERIMQVQALAETAATGGSGRIWLAVTAHGDVQALSQNVQQEQYAKINQRFALRCTLSNDDINKVVEERLLRKTQAGRSELASLFAARAGELADLGTVLNAQRVYPMPTAETFAQTYPYLPWIVAAVPDLVRGIAQAANRGDELTGSTRTLVGVVQGAIIDAATLLDRQLGPLLCLTDVYGQVESDVPIETKTDLGRILVNVPGATDYTPRVARALFLLGGVGYIPTTLENVARALVDRHDASLAGVREDTRAELDRLVGAGYAKLVGETYIFLTTQQRSFQDAVREGQRGLHDSTYDLGQSLKAYDSEEALRVDRVTLSGREIALKLTVDGRTVRNPAAPVTLHILTPLQRAIDPALGDDEAMRQRSNADPSNLYLRMDDVKGLRNALALARATELEADRVLSSPQSGPSEQEVARQAKAQDLPSYRAEVSRLLATALRGGVIFFRGSLFNLAPAESVAASVRATLAQAPLLPTIYSRFGELPHRVANEDAAVKAALAGNVSNADLAALGVYHADGTLNEASPLVSTLRGHLPLAEHDAGLLPADDLRAELEKPPFGWDGNAVKVGLALLLRSSACRLVESGRTITDPASAEALRLLTKEQSFKALRVQGVRSDIDSATLKLVRAEIEALFGVKPPLVASTLHNELGSALGNLGTRAGSIQSWASTAQCPLPPSFAAGRALVDDLIAAGVPAQRLQEFHDRVDALREYHDQLDRLDRFQRDNGAAFTDLRDFFTGMVNANLDVPTLRAFVSDWRTVAGEGAVTEPGRWADLSAAAATAKKDLAARAAQWWAKARVDLATAQDALAAQITTAGVPEDAREAEAAALSLRFADVRRRLDEPHDPTDAVAAQKVLTALAAVNLDIPGAIRELRERYRPAPSEHEVHISWRDLLGATHIATADDLRRVQQCLVEQVERALAAHKMVMIE